MRSRRRRPATICNSIRACWDIGRSAKTHQRLLPFAIDDGMPGDGIGAIGLNKNSDIIARTAGSSSQSQPDPSQGTDVGLDDSRPRGRTTTSAPMSEGLSLKPEAQVSPKIKPKSESRFKHSVVSCLRCSCSAHVVSFSPAHGRAV